MTVSNKQTIGTLNGVPLVVDIGAGLGSDAGVNVTLSRTLVLAYPPGFPTAPGHAGQERSEMSNTYLSGTVIKVFPAVKAAIVAAGGGS